MAESLPPNPEIDGSQDSGDSTPRREASARFVIDSRPGEAASLREAMDPANQSLAEAMRLTFRVLQIVIVVLVFLFVFSGFRSVQEGSSGVKTLFGMIHGAHGDESLAPGPVLYWPYPAGEVITFPVKRSVDLGNEYWPHIKDPSKRLDEIAATPDDGVIPGQDGSLLTKDGDIYHMKVSAEYTIADPRQFVESFEPAYADRLVMEAVRRGVVQTAGSLTLNELTDIKLEPIESIKSIAQSTLNALSCGITIDAINIVDATAPLATRAAYSDVARAMVASGTAETNANQEKENTLNRIAGPDYKDVMAMIDAYDNAITLDDDAAAKQILDEIGSWFESEAAAGEVSMIIADARAYRSSIRADLGADTRRFLEVFKAWKENPDVLVSSLWFDAVDKVLTRHDVEIVSLPGWLGQFNFTAQSSREVWDRRRKADLALRKVAAGLSGPNEFNTRRAQDITIGGRGERRAGRQLDENAESTRKPQE